MITPRIYAEVYAVLSLLGDNYIRKIPRSMLNAIVDNRDKDFKVELDENKPLEQQNLSNEAMSFLAMLKLDYWCDTVEKKDELKNILLVNEYKETGGNLANEDKKAWIKRLKKS